MNRDLRDPTALGEAILDLRTIHTVKGREDELCSASADAYRHALEAIPDYDGSNDIKTATPSGAEH